MKINIFNQIFYVFKLMPFNSVANQTENNFLEINFQKLKNNNIKFIIFDVDQTIVPQSENILSREVLSKFNDIDTYFDKKNLCFISNEPSTLRSNMLMEQLNIHMVDTKSISKPNPLAFNYAKKYFGNNVSENEVCFIGDRIWTDIIGANYVGMYTIKVDAFDPNSDRKITLLLRLIESITTKIFKIL